MAPQSPSPLAALLERALFPTNLKIILAAASLLIMIVGTVMAYSTNQLPLPNPGPAPERPETTTLSTYRYVTTFYRSILEEDAKKAKLRPVSIGAIARGNAHRVELEKSKGLGKDDKLQTSSLVLSLRKRKLWVGNHGNRFRANHWVLRITNRLQHPVAYRVTTHSSGQCRSKALIAHNAIAITAGGTEERTECLASRRRLTVSRIEVLDLTPLGYVYVSRLDPRALEYPVRTAEGHIHGPLAHCRSLPRRAISGGILKGEFSWIDVLDFYSRHNCDEYSFFGRYRWTERGVTKLPVNPQTYTSPTASALEDAADEAPASP